MRPKAQIISAVLCFLAASHFHGSFLFAGEAENIAKCEEQLKAIGQAMRQYVDNVGGGRNFPKSLAELVEKKLLDKSNLRCPGDRSPKVEGGFLVGYQAAFEFVQEPLTNRIPAMRPLVWDKPGNHVVVNMTLLADGRVIKFTNENEFREYVGGWESKRYMQKTGSFAKPTDDLLRGLREEGEGVKAQEVVELLAQRGPIILPNAFRELAWGVPAQRRLLTSIVEKMGPAAEEILLKDLNSSDASDRERSLGLLSAMGSRAADERFIKLLETRYESAQLMGIESLVILQAKAAIPALTKLAQSGAATTPSRVAAILALGKLAGREAMPVLQAALKDKDISVQIAAGKVLARLKDPSVLAELQRMHKQSDAEQRKEILAAYAALGSEDSIRHLQGELQIKSEARVLAALKTIREEKLTRLLNDIYPLLEAGPYDVRMEAARVLGDLGERAALPPLYRALESKNLDYTRVVQSAIDRLEESGLMEEDTTLADNAPALVSADNTPVFQNKVVAYQLPKGQLCTVLKTQGGWAWIQTLFQGQNSAGWVESKLLVPDEKRTALPMLTRITADTAEVMNGQMLLTTLPKGQLVLLSQENNAWFLLITILGTQRVSGWTSAQNLSLESPGAKSEPKPFKAVSAMGLPRTGDTGVSALAISADGQWLAFGTQSGRLELWDLSQGKKVVEQQAGGSVIALAFPATEHLLIGATDKEIKEFNLEAGLEAGTTRKWPAPNVSSACLFPEQGRAAIPFSVTDKEKGTTTWLVKALRYKGESMAMAVRDGAEEALPDDGVGDGEFRRDTGIFKKEKPLGEAPVQPLPPGGALPPAQEPGANLPPKEDPGQAGGEEPAAAAAATLNTAGLPLSDGNAQLSDGSRPVQQLVSAPAGFYLVATRPTKCELVDLFTLRSLGTLETGARGKKTMAFSPSQRYVATGGEDGLVRVWETLSRRLRRLLQPNGGRVFCLALAADERTLAVFTEASGVQIWDFQAPKMIQTLDYRGFAKVMQFTEDAKSLLIGSSDSTISLFRR